MNKEIGLCTFLLYPMSNIIDIPFTSIIYSYAVLY